MAHATAVHSTNKLSYGDVMNAQAAMRHHSHSTIHDPYGRRNSPEDRLQILEDKLEDQQKRIQHLDNKVYSIEAQIGVLRMEAHQLLEALYKFNAIPKGHV